MRFTHRYGLQRPVRVVRLVNKLDDPYGSYGWTTHFYESIRAVVLDMCVFKSRAVLANVPRIRCDTRCLSFARRSNCGRRRGAIKMLYTLQRVELVEFNSVPYYRDASVLLGNILRVKLMWGYIRDPSGIFSISMTSFPAFKRLKMASDRLSI